MGTNPTDVDKSVLSISPFFIVKDLQVSIAHYVERFGFQVDFQGPPDDVYYAGVSRDGIGIMLKAILPDVLPQPNHTRHPWARWDAYINVTDVDTLYEEYTSKGVVFYSPLGVNSDNLRGFELQDADGYVLYFGRMAKPGDSPVG